MVLWVLLLVVVIAVFVAFNAFVLPKVFLLAYYDVKNSSDRGIKTIEEVNGRSIIYEPELSVRKYINQYILSMRDGKKYIICKFDSAVKFIDYDVVLFGEYGEICKVINVQEIVSENHIAKQIDIPQETTYATLAVNAVNGNKFKAKTIKPVSIKRLATYSLCSAFSIAVGVICVKLCCAKLFGGLFDEIFMVSAYSNLVTILIGIILIVLNLVSAILLIKGKNRKLKGEVKNA